MPQPITFRCPRMPPARMPILVGRIRQDVSDPSGLLNRDVRRRRSAAEGRGLECGADRRVSARGSEDHRRVTHAACRASTQDVPRPARPPAALLFCCTPHAPCTQRCPMTSMRCGRTVAAAGRCGTTPLHAARKLDEAARRVAGGAALPAALSAAGYSARSSAEIHVASAGGATRRALSFVAAHFCAQVTDPAARDIGIAQFGDDTWIVLAAPLVVPQARDAAAISRRVLELVNSARAQPQRCGHEQFDRGRGAGTVRGARRCRARSFGRHGGARLFRSRRR